MLYDSTTSGNRFSERESERTVFPDKLSMISGANFDQIWFFSGFCFCRWLPSIQRVICTRLKRLENRRDSFFFKSKPGRERVEASTGYTEPPFAMTINLMFLSLKRLAERLPDKLAVIDFRRANAKKPLCISLITVDNLDQIWLKSLGHWSTSFQESKESESNWISQLNIFTENFSDFCLQIFNKNCLQL